MLIGGLVLAGSGQATDDAAAAALIRELSGKAINVLQRSDVDLATREREFRDLLAKDFDLKLIGRVALGRHYRTLTPEQREDYRTLFADYILKTYAARLGGYAGETFEVIGTTELNSRDVVVNTRIRRPAGPPIEAGWRVRNYNGQAKIVDVVVAGVSMALTHRQEFSAVVSRNGIDGLFDALRARADKLSASAAN